MRGRFGIETMYIVGGSARAVLDAAYGFKPLSMRDLDLFGVANGEVTRAAMQKVAGAVAALGYEAKPVEDRQRGNIALGGPAGVNYNAGYGVFLQKPGEQDMLDLTLLHSPEALALNGPLNIDRIQIPLRAGETLRSVWQRMRGRSYDELVARGVVVDADGGYRGWRGGRVALVCKGDVWADVERMKGRLVKSYLKANAKMPLSLLRELRTAPQLRERQPLLERRYVKRVLDLPLPDAVTGLRLLRLVKSEILADPQLQADPRYQEVAAAVAARRSARAQRNGQLGRRRARPWRAGAFEYGALHR